MVANYCPSLLSEPKATQVSPTIPTIEPPLYEKMSDISDQTIYYIVYFKI